MRLLQQACWLMKLLDKESIEKLKTCKSHCTPFWYNHTMRSRQICCSYNRPQICQDAPVRTIIKEAKKADTIIHYVDKERLDKMSKTGYHQGVVHLCTVHICTYKP